MQQELISIALDLTWTWDDRIKNVFTTLSPDLWEESQHNPIAVLHRLGPEGVERQLDRGEVQTALETARRALQEHREHRAELSPAETPVTIAYFSMEFGLTEALPIYSGGLGILAGDHLKAASDVGMPLVGVGLLYRKGFGRQRIDDSGQQYEVFPQSDFNLLPLTRATDGSGRQIHVECPLGGRTLQLAVWRAQVGRVPLVLLDSDVEANASDLRTITDQLYAPEPHRRLPQEVVLGVGGMRALRALGVEATAYHMNEGHGFLVAIERIHQLRRRLQLGLDDATALARAELVFTTHTPVAAGSDYFDPALVRDLLGPYLAEVGFPLDRFLDLGRRSPEDEREPLCTTYVALRTADCAVGVSRLHGEVSRRLWKDAWPGVFAGEVPIGSVTNGVHMPTWVAPEIAALLRRYVFSEWWSLDPDDPRWEGVQSIPGDELWACHRQLRHRLVAFARPRCDGGRLDPEALTIGFSRRFAPYKRANLVLTDRRRLERLLGDPARPLQMIFSGKAHPADLQGKEILHDIVAASRQEARIAFLPDYDIEVARPLVQGADIWLNNPRRFLEASGTSGMKAAANGVLNLSVLDGWWDEAYRPQLGWAIPTGATLENPNPDDGAEAEALYQLLEQEVVPLFYDRGPGGIPERWVSMMRASIRHVAAHFSARRMVLEYYNGCYQRAAHRARELRELARWPG